MVTADHGPAVSGAHNTIVAARAGKDLVSSLVSGLLTIGPRFGGALDDAARMMSGAVDKGMDPLTFTKEMRKENKLIMGIGHRIKSLDNPDMRVVIIKDFAQKHFPSNACLDFALGVEQITTSKRANLILNVDGCIAVCFVDLMRTCGAFTREEADEVRPCLEPSLRCRAGLLRCRAELLRILWAVARDSPLSTPTRTQLIENGCLNGLFVLGRSIGFIGHYLGIVHLPPPPPPYQEHL